MLPRRPVAGAAAVLESWLLGSLTLSKSLRNRFSRANATLVRRLGHRAYLSLALLFTVFIVADASLFHFVRTMEYRIFDALVTYRLRAPGPDRDMVIINVDEASLADLGRDIGRWPWPNHVFGELVAGLERQKPKAIIFDVLFSDPDIARPDSDAYFSEVIAGTRNTFFPMLRLGPQNDVLSEVRPGMLPGVKSLPGATAEDLPLAIVLPKIPAAIENGRLGTFNVDPDKDSVVRRYPVYLEHAGWRIPSLPTRVAEELGFPLPPEREFLLNWRGKPYTYAYVSFTEVYRDLLRKQRQRPADEFTGKIIFIGSTATSLFDIKASPLSKIHPGIEILATAVDNIKNDDWLWQQPGWLTLCIGLIFVWGMAVALSRQTNIATFDTVFTVLQVTLIALSYATLNLSNVYLDMSAPFTMGLVYFSVARLYANQSQRWLANNQLYSIRDQAEGRCRMTVMAVRVAGAKPSERRRMKAEINRLVAASPVGASRITNLVEDPGLVQDVFSDTMLLYWLNAASDDARVNGAVRDDAAAVQAGLRKRLARFGDRLSFRLHSDDLQWNLANGWKDGARGIILRALEHTASRSEKGGESQ